ncbi:uncharacterized protein LOC134277542 [Saccostrea cucullata]|uniref:uncharacterized protein LOC134277542 n=1 Tax=Saccostrea cuccullata TaxID=36930 RepID=UPI002ED4B89B
MCYTVVHTYAKVTRYNEFGHLIQTIQNTTEGQKLYCKPFYITENRNEDIIVSDLHLNAVVVTDREGRHRFSYKGHPSGFEPGNICTDELSHILVCDCWTRTVQMLDKDGGFLTLIPIDQKGIKIPESVVYDSKSHLLWVGIKNSNEVFVYRYYIRGQQANLEEGCDKQENPKDNNISTWWSEEEYI